jgi:hypothetical protein
LESQIQKRGEEPLDVQPELRQVAEHKFIGSTHWVGAGGGHHERFQVITFRERKITDLQDCRSLREAEHFARRHAASQA